MLDLKRILLGGRSKMAATQPIAGQVSTLRAADAPIPRSVFDEARYLAGCEPTDAEAIDAGSAYEHYIRHGREAELSGDRPIILPAIAPRLSSAVADYDAVVDRLVELEVENQLLKEAWDRHLRPDLDIDFEMLSEEIDDALAPPLDRSDCDESRLDADQLQWRREGFLIKPGFFPYDLLDRYSAVRERVPHPIGWLCPVPYMHVKELRDVCLYPELSALLAKLVGEEMGLHLNLTGWISTDRNWHQDDYLNPPYINSWYAAAWIALDDIHPDSGPFEFVPGSHRWPLMRSSRVRLFLKPEERQDIGWPAQAERFVNDIADREIARRGLPTRKFIAKKGDLLIWHGRLMHRGSYANVPGMPRKSLIGHYSGLSHRIDMKTVARTEEGSPYFHLPLPLDFDPYGELATAGDS